MDLEGFLRFFCRLGADSSHLVFPPCEGHAGLLYWSCSCGRK